MFSEKEISQPAELIDITPLRVFEPRKQKLKENTLLIFPKFVFYLQIEKYARQSLSEGVEDPSELRVTRDCELFKALNNHYNKTNEFEVKILANPDSFINLNPFETPK